MMNTRNHVYQKQAALLLSRSAVRNNVDQIRARSNKTLIAVVKDNGYGTGLFNEFSVLRQCGVDFFAVINAEEARQLRGFGYEGPVLLLAPEHSVWECSNLMQLDIIFMLGSAHQADVLRKAAAQTGLTPRVHLKIDTGLGRYGFDYQNLGEVVAALQGLKLEGCYSHIASGAVRMKKQLALQKRRFDNALMALRLMGVDPGMTHLAASSAFALAGDMGYDAIRVGTLLLGRCSVPGRAEELGLRDAVSFQARIQQVRMYTAGATLSYAAKKLHVTTRVGLLPVGLGDGIRPRRNMAAQKVLGSGMDFTLLDLNGTELGEGDEVTLLVNPLLVHSATPRRLV